ncbi:hypothetical protein BC827DRAFT_552157 [Russula dissimulans]|nr:hypothetical protein BC827DRAFT_552157 [Russula dissimulans]
MPPSSTSAWLTNTLTEDDALVHSDLIREYEPFFIKVGRWGQFEHADIQRNDIRDGLRISAPNFVAEFERTLDGKPGLDPNGSAWAQVNISDPSWGATYLSEERNPGRYVGEGEVKHVSILSQTFNWENLWQESGNRRLKGDLANYLFFLPFLPQLQPTLTNDTITARIDEGMPFHFITQREDIQDLENNSASTILAPIFLYQSSSFLDCSWRLIPQT